jgi:hypothetical protein
MKSRTADYCEWCRKPLAAGVQQAPTAQQAAPIQQAPQVRISLTGEAVEAAPPAPPEAYGLARMPQPGAGSPLQAGALPLGAITPALIQSADAPEIAWGERWELCLALLLPLIAVCMALAHAATTYHSAVFLAAFGGLFFGGLILGATGAIPSYDDAVLDCSVVLVVSVFMTPILALVVYLIVCAVKQECNAAACALLGFNFVFALLLFMAYPLTMIVLPILGILPWFATIGVVFSFAGWLVSSFFRPVTE